MVNGQETSKKDTDWLAIGAGAVTGAASGAVSWLQFFEKNKDKVTDPDVASRINKEARQHALALKDTFQADALKDFSVFLENYTPKNNQAFQFEDGVIDALVEKYQEGGTSLVSFVLDPDVGEPIKGLTLNDLNEIVDKQLALKTQVHNKVFDTDEKKHLELIEKAKNLTTTQKTIAIGIGLVTLAGVGLLVHHLRNREQPDTRLDSSSNPQLENKIQTEQSADKSFI